MVDRGNGAACLVLEQAHKLAHSGQLVLWGGATAQVFQGNAGQTRQVPGEQPRGFFGGAGVGGDKGFLQVGQLPLQAFGEELLLEAGGGLGWALSGACAIQKDMNLGKGSCSSPQSVLGSLKSKLAHAN